MAAKPMGSGQVPKNNVLLIVEVDLSDPMAGVGTELVGNAEAGVFGVLLHGIVPAHHGMGFKYAHQAVLGDVSVKHFGFSRNRRPHRHAFGNAAVIVHHHKVLEHQTSLFRPNSFVPSKSSTRAFDWLTRIFVHIEFAVFVEVTVRPGRLMVRRGAGIACILCYPKTNLFGGRITK
jgi:hypothetical protein